LDGLPPC
jgi:hypothetical protein